MTILNGVNQYFVDNASFPAGPYSSCPTTDNVGTGGVDIADFADTGTLLYTTYLADIPQDPSIGTQADTGYDICQDANDRITVSAPESLNDGETSTISATR